jgi:hypothetical protein
LLILTFMSRLCFSNALCALLMALLAPFHSQAQSADAGSVAPLAPNAVTKALPLPPAISPAIAWSTLSAEQKMALAPLETTWGQLSAGHQRKWIALSTNHPQMTADEKDKLQARMVQWATLSPKQREQARLNFAHTKKIPSDGRAATWETYQALSDEEKKAFAQSAPKKPAGAAVAAKPVPAQKLAEVPVTRKTPAPVTDDKNSTPLLNRNTLLPQLAKPKAAAQAPAN